MSSQKGNSLLEALHSLRDDLQRDMRARFDRDLPLDELVFDRWQRAAALGFGEGASIYHNAYLLGDVRVAAHTWIGPLVMLDGSGGGIDIGTWCCISAGVHVYTHDTVKRSLTGGRAEPESAPVGIGDYTYIGTQSVILPGVSIGHHCVVGASSLVNRDVPPCSIAVGVPARVRGRVELDATGESVELRWDQ